MDLPLYSRNRSNLIPSHLYINFKSKCFVRNQANLKLKKFLELLTKSRHWFNNDWQFGAIKIDHIIFTLENVASFLSTKTILDYVVHVLFSTFLFLDWYGLIVEYTFGWDYTLRLILLWLGSFRWSVWVCYRALEELKYAS